MIKSGDVENSFQAIKLIPNPIHGENKQRPTTTNIRDQRRGLGNKKYSAISSDLQNLHLGSSQTGPSKVQ